jgi:hypothetical protein
MDAFPATAVVVDAQTTCAVAFAIFLGTRAVFFVAFTVTLAAGHMRLLFQVDQVSRQVRAWRECTCCILNLFPCQCTARPIAKRQRLV